MTKNEYKAITQWIKRNTEELHRSYSEYLNFIEVKDLLEYLKRYSPNNFKIKWVDHKTHKTIIVDEENVL